jgi:hypothetical protein
LNVFASVPGKFPATLVDSQAALRDVALSWIQRYFAERMSGLVGEQIAEAQLQRDTLRTE